MVLVNGAEGIGTGWSTFIPNFSPRDIVANLRRLLLGEEMEPMQPWYKNFKGSIQEIPTKTQGKSYACNGLISKVRANLHLARLFLLRKPSCSPPLGARQLGYIFNCTLRTSIVLGVEHTV